MIQKRRILETSLFAAALTLVSFAAPVLAAPTDASLPAAPVIKLTTAAAALKPSAVKTVTPAAPPAAVKSDRPPARRHSDYRYSNPTRWHSDMTANSIRNQ